MITFSRGPYKFTFRTVGIIRCAGRLLLHCNPDEPFWSLPGGRVELLEAAGSALARELEEELGTPAQVGPLCWLIENFFAHDNRAYHEIGHYFAVTLPDDSACGAIEGPFYSSEPDNSMVYQWFRPEEHSALTIVPRCIPQLLAAPQAGVQHIVWVDPVCTELLDQLRVAYRAEYST